MFRIPLGNFPDNCMILGNKWGWASHNSTFGSVLLHLIYIAERLNVLLGDGSGGNLRESSISINFIQLAGTGGVGGKK